MSLQTYWLVAPLVLAMFSAVLAVVGIKLIDLADHRNRGADRADAAIAWIS